MRRKKPRSLAYTRGESGAYPKKTRQPSRLAFRQGRTAGKRVAADDDSACERSREQALSVAKVPPGDAVLQPLVHAFAAAAGYRGEGTDSNSCPSNVRPVSWGK